MELIEMTLEQLQDRIIEVLSNGALSTENLLHKIGIEPGGGELVAPMRELRIQGLVKRYETFMGEDDLVHETFIYELVEG